MTGSLALQEYIQKHSQMIKDTKKVSVKNLQLLNQICREITLSLCHPLLEFVDDLLEKFMYPESVESNVNRDIFTLGHPRLLEIIYLKQRIGQLQELNHEGFEPVKQFFPQMLNKIEKIHVILVHLLQVLSNHIEIPTQSRFYKRIVMESISDFQRAFGQFKALDYILMTLMKYLENTGSTDKTFVVDNTLLQQIKTFDSQNRQWFDDILQESKALTEFNEQADGHSDIAAFLKERKSRLRIAGRRVF